MDSASGRVVIIGGGVIGCFVAYFLRDLGHVGPIAVIERDSSYRFASTSLSAASIRTQFGCRVNVELSLFGASFLKRIGQIFDDEVDVGLVERGYLILTPPEAVGSRRDALRMQREAGADVAELTPAELSRRAPWINSDGVAMATLGLSGEGWFDAWSLLQAVRRAARKHNVEFIQAEASGIELSGGRVSAVRTTDGARHAADWCVNAAGALSGRIAGWLGMTIPVVPKKRTVFRFKAPLDGGDMPMLFDISGAWMRPEGDGFIGGIQPPAVGDPDAYDDFDPDHALFDQLWPLLAGRIPALEQLRVTNAWAGHYEMNMFDHNGIVGPHPDTANFLFATGFSGHGVMHSPGVGRAVAEHIISGRYRTIDVSPLGFDRIANGVPMPESAIY